MVVLKHILKGDAYDCDGCAAVVVDGIVMHQVGCVSTPTSMTLTTCRSCPTKFIPDDTAQAYCSDACARKFYGWPPSPK